MGHNGSHLYDVTVKLTNLRYNIDQLQGLVEDWQQRFGCTFQQHLGKVKLVLGTVGKHQLTLYGKIGRKYLHVLSAEIAGTKLQEKALLQLMEWVVSVQTNDMDILGLVISKAGQHNQPLVVHNGQIYDKASMMDLLWQHYCTTKVRESRKIEAVYHFLRDVPQG